MTSPLLDIRNLHARFPSTRGWQRRASQAIRAVDGVSLAVESGETLGIVGESGCGKSTLARCALRLIEPTSGSVLYEGRDVLKLGRVALRSLRRDLQMVFQDPQSSLNPRMNIRSVLSEVLRVHRIVPKREVTARVQELLELVGLDPACSGLYPHELSGGQRQRVGIARALAVEPRLLICDEPVSSLDASIQAQILNLLQELQRRLGLTYLFISHDLRIVRQICTRVAVMYLGKLVEVAPTEQLFGSPLHPYTRALLSAVPRIGREKRIPRRILSGDVPGAGRVPTGCAFHPRCPEALEECSRVQLGDPVEVDGRQAVACLLHEPSRRLPSPPEVPPGEEGKGSGRSGA